MLISEPPPEAEELHFRLGYRRGLDGLRGISILTVIGFHYGFPHCRGGFLGVDVFFVLSGFLITALLLQEWEQTGTFSLRDFYIRRALRILPALLVMLVAYLIYGLLWAQSGTRGQVYTGTLLTLFYVANWVRAFWGEEPLGLLGHAWSLSIEEQFYMLWPLLLRTMLPWRREWVLVLVLGGIAASALLRSLMFAGPASVPRLYNGLDTRADALLVGCAAAIVMSCVQPRTQRAHSMLAAVTVLSVSVLAVLIVNAEWDAPYMYRGVMTLVALAAGVIVVRVVTGRGGFVRTLQVPPLVWIGRISYGLYLWHFPVARIVSPLDPSWRGRFIALACTLAFASLSFYIIERPLLRLKERFTIARR